MPKFAALGIALSCCLAITAPAAASIIQDGTFQNSIGTGNDLTPWSDWTSVGITTHAAPIGIPGNYASIPVGGDLFQRFPTLGPGNYQLSFLVQNASPWAAQLVLAIQQQYGTPLAIGFATGTVEILDLVASSEFTRETFNFTINNLPFDPNEFYFSNSYDAVGPYNPNSLNLPGTIINVADVSIQAVPEPSTWAMMLMGFAALGSAIRWRSRIRLAKS